MKYCNNCGQEISDTAKFCKHCGAKIIQVEEVVTPAPNELIIKEDPSLDENNQVVEEKPKKVKKEKKKGKGSRIAGNILWFILGGAIWGIGLGIVAIACFITIIGIPAGFQYLKTCKFVFSPFGKEKYVVKKGFWRTLANIIWCITGGLISALGFALWGVILCITIIGIPFAKQYFKLAGFIIWPYGRDFKLAEN